MTSLIACLSTGTGTWSQVYRIIRENPWDRVFIITNDFGAQKFEKNEKTELILVDFNAALEQIVGNIKQKLEGKISDFEVAVNIISGSGKEHTAILAAIIQLGLGFRLVVAGEKGLQSL